MLRAGHSQTRGNQRGRRRALHTPRPPRRLRGRLLGPTSGGWGWSACAGPRPAPREPRSVFRAEAGPGRREAGKREGDRGARRSRRGGGSGAGMGGAGALLRPAALVSSRGPAGRPPHSPPEPAPPAPRLSVPQAPTSPGPLQPSLSTRWVPAPPPATPVPLLGPLILTLVFLPRAY